jgi:uncharacterized protein DUF5335
MLTEIPAPDWPAFFDSFSRQHEGWLVTLADIPGPAAEPHVSAADMPLDGCGADLERQTISIAVGREPDRHLIHLIDKPVKVQLEQSTSGKDEGLRIERREGAVTRLTFTHAARPEEVDGLAREAPTR